MGRKSMHSRDSRADPFKMGADVTGDERLAPTT